MKPPAYDLRPVELAEIRHLFEEHHAYRSVGAAATYAFGLFEAGRVVAGFTWQPPPPGAARSVCAEIPHGVLSLSRMVAVPREQRTGRLRNPLRRMMRHLIDRTRWPVLVTYSDESVGHTGYLYKITGWRPTKRSLVTTLTVAGARVSRYANGNHVTHDDAVRGAAWIQRWEHWSTSTPALVFDRAWERVPIPGKRWASGQPAFTYRPRAG